MSEEKPPAYPDRYVREVTLRDGARLTLRPIRPADARIEADFVRNLSPESRYYRFMDTLRELSPRMLSHFTEIDYDRHMALIATVGTAADETEIGVARYVAAPDGASCEFAIVVADDWQRRGVASELMRTLMSAAREHGFSLMYGEVLPSNRRMLELMDRLGFTMRRDADDPHLLRAELRLT